MASLLFLIASACIGLAYATYRLFGPGRYSAGERLLYAPVYFLARILWRVEVEWRDGFQLPVGSARSAKDYMLADRMQTGALLIANHRCSVDPFFVQLVSGKRVHWMVAGEYFKHALFGPLLRSYQAIPTNRAGVDTASTKRAIALAKSGRFVGMFPEGRINRTESPLLSIRPGAAIVAIKAGVPMVPIWIEGAPRGWEVYSALFVPAKVRIIVGRPSLFNKSAQETIAAANPNESDDARPIMSSERVRAREDAVAWITDTMLQALKMGGTETDIVIAGRKWVDS
ncbi:MAG: lysophospholipid acyltransferase family protein [Pirellula sp.]